MWITKKDFTAKKKAILSIVFALWLIIIIGMGSSNSETPSTDASNPSSSVSESNKDGSNEENDVNDASSTPEKEELPDIPLADDFEKAIWKVIDTNDAKLVSIETVDVEGSEETSIIASVSCKNDEVVVDTILEAVKTIVVESERNEGVIFTFGDIDDGDDASLLLMAGVYNDGTIDKSMVSIDFNSARNIWIRDQFSAWDGSHRKLKELILKNLNDEKSYDHIETTYIDVNSEERINNVNKILSDAGYSQRVEMDDLFISTQFSAKNAFGGTVKNTAYGIASYSNQTITLIGIE
ncbi:MAG: hypothetical protein M0Q52_11460 [Lascolabacillus sp.]|nr:hypothetical protein [Lascolabacillus sp.]